MTAEPQENNGRDPETGQFIVGHIGIGGRPKGARNKLGEDFLQALQADFAEHGPAVIAEVRADKPADYLKIIAGILPKVVHLDDGRDLSDEELDRRIRQLAAALDIQIGFGGAISGPVANQGGSGRSN